MEDYEKVGYLNTTHKIFYILESKMKEIDLHYHDFNKILILLNGHVDYYIEGKTYPLLPNDIILVSAGKVHRPILSDNSPYERIIIYVSDNFLKSNEVERPVILEIVKNSEDITKLEITETYQKALEAYEFLNSVAA